jgi:hypothetical protein
MQIYFQQTMKASSINVKAENTLETCIYTPLLYTEKKKVKLSLQQAVESQRVVRHRGSHIFKTISSQMAVRSSALLASRPLPPGRFLVLISVGG